MNCDKDLLKKITDFSNVLHDSNISDDHANELVKKYKKQLENLNIINGEDFADKLKNTNLDLTSENREELVNCYKNQLDSNKPVKNKDDYDSLLFLSKISNKKYSKFKIKSFMKTKILNFDKCINYLKETERMNIIKHDEIDNFLEFNRIYFDDEEHYNKPKRDTLYRRVNNNYYVTNTDYFEKCTDFYFKLYSNIFAIFNLKIITLKYHNNEVKMNEVSSNINSGFVNIGGKVNSTNKKQKNNEIVMKFNRNKLRKDMHINFNNCNGTEEEIKFLINEMPENLKKSMYNPYCILSLIKNRTKNTLTKFEQVQTIENTDIERIEGSIETTFNLPIKLGLFVNSSNSNYINKRVVFTMEFYDINNLEVTSEDETDSETDSDMDVLHIGTTVEANYHELGRWYSGVITEICEDGTFNILYDDGEREYGKHRSFIRAKDGVTKNINNSSNTPSSAVMYNNTTPAEIRHKRNKKVEQQQQQQQPQQPQQQQEEKILKWKYIKRGTILPKYKIEGGTTKSDGRLFVGKINNSPGKVNIDNGKIWNYWVQNKGSSDCGYMLITNYKYEWKHITRGGKIPKNAIFCGNDEHGDKVWVGKSLENEPGKITCQNNKDKNPTMQNLWCHSAWMGYKNAYILIVLIDNKETYLTELEEEI